MVLLCRLLLGLGVVVVMLAGQGMVFALDVNNPGNGLEPCPVRASLVSSLDTSLHTDGTGGLF